VGSGEGLVVRKSRSEMYKPLQLLQGPGEYCLKFTFSGPEAELRDDADGGAHCGEELLPDERAADGAAAAAPSRDGRHTVPRPGHRRSEYF
jgi:hypothetical protein